MFDKRNVLVGSGGIFIEAIIFLSKNLQLRAHGVHSQAFIKNEINFMTPEIKFLHLDCQIGFFLLVLTCFISPIPRSHFYKFLK